MNILCRLTNVSIVAFTAVCMTSCHVHKRVEEIGKIEDFHKSVMKNKYVQLLTDKSKKGGTCVDLYIDYSDCMTTASSSSYYTSVQPAIVSFNPNYYSIKGDSIKYETNDKMKVYELLNHIKNVDYSNIKGAVDNIIKNKRESILITDGEYWQKGKGANLNNPYLADEFRQWLSDGHDIYIYSEPYTYEGLNKNRYYMLFTDHCLENNIQEIFSRNAPKSYSVKMVHLYSGTPTFDGKGVVFNEQLLIDPNMSKYSPELLYESHMMDANWDDVYDYVFNATDEDGNRLPGGDYFLKGIKINVSDEDAYRPVELEAKCYEISNQYVAFESNGTKSILPSLMENMFVIDEKAWAQGEVVLKFNPNFGAASLTGISGNLLKIDICVKKSEENFSNNSVIGDKFKFNSRQEGIVYPNTSIYESLKQTLKDPSISPENSENPVIYSIYVSSYCK